MDYDDEFREQFNGIRIDPRNGEELLEHDVRVSGLENYTHFPEHLRTCLTTFWVPDYRHIKQGNWVMIDDHGKVVGIINHEYLHPKGEKDMTDNVEKVTSVSEVVDRLRQQTKLGDVQWRVQKSYLSDDGRVLPIDAVAYSGGVDFQVDFLHSVLYFCPRRADNSWLIFRGGEHPSVETLIDFLENFLFYPQVSAGLLIAYNSLAPRDRQQDYDLVEVDRNLGSRSY